MSMNRKIYPRLGLVLLVVGLISFSALNTLLFGSLRLDLTENRLYTISPGTREIIDSIEEPIDLYFSIPTGPRASWRRCAVMPSGCAN